MSLCLKLCFMVSLIYLCQFVESYIPRKNKICSKIVYTATGSEIENFCCSGYMNSGSSIVLRCKPICHTGCPNGKCVAPDTCYCDVGYAIDPATFSCEPKCSEPCYNGDCVAPETCKCRSGFRVYNATYCKPILNLCSPSCFNGDCVGRNKCQCHDGYQLSGWASDGFDYTCLPHTTTSISTPTAEMTSVDDNEMLQTVTFSEASYLYDGVTDEDKVVTDQDASHKAEDAETMTEPISTTEDVNQVTTAETNVTDGSMTVIVYFGGMAKPDDNSQNDENMKNGTNVLIYISVAILLMIVVILLMVAYRRRLLGYIKGRTYVVQDQQTRRASTSSRTFNVTFSSNGN